MLNLCELNLLTVLISTLGIKFKLHYPLPDSDEDELQQLLHKGIHPVIQFQYYGVSSMKKPLGAAFHKVCLLTLSSLFC